MPLFIRPIEIIDVLYFTILLITGIYKWIYIGRFSALIDVKKKELPIRFPRINPRLLYIPLFSYFYEYYLILRFREKSKTLNIIRILFGFKLVELISVVLLFQTFWPYPVNLIALSLYHLVLIGKMFCRYKWMEICRIDYIPSGKPSISNSSK
jgi:hypothetical protein